LLHERKEQFLWGHLKNGKVDKCSFHLILEKFYQGVSTQYYLCHTNVIDRVNDMAKDQPRLLMFADRDGNEILDDTSHAVESRGTPSGIPGVLGDVLRSQEWIRRMTWKSAFSQTIKNDPNNTPPPLEPITEGTEGKDTANEGNNNDNPTFEHNDDPMGAQDVETPRQINRHRLHRAKEKKIDIRGLQLHPKPVGVRSSRAMKAVQSYIPSMKGKAYGYSAAQIESIEHDPRVVELVLTQLT
jgi:hypothetical protein